MPLSTPAAPRPSPLSVATTVSVYVPRLPAGGLKCRMPLPSPLSVERHEARQRVAGDPVLDRERHRVAVGVDRLHGLVERLAGRERDVGDRRDDRRVVDDQRR